MLWKRLAVILVGAPISVAVLGYYMSHHVRYVSILEIVSNPQSFDGAHVLLNGHIEDLTPIPMFGPKYMLRDSDNDVEIALFGKGGKGATDNIDLAPYVSFVFDGANYTQIRNITVSVVGYVRYIGFAIDASPFSS